MNRSLWGYVGAAGLACTTIALGCSGKTFTDNGDGGTPGADGGGGPGACPSAQPASGGACTPEGRVCAYGDDPRPECRPTTVCSSGQWTTPKNACPGLPPTTCPPTRADAQGQACSPQGAFCSYDNGLACQCTDCPPSSPSCRPGPTLWSCDSPNPNPQCPPAIPNLGTACSPEGQSCDYGCSQGLGRICQGGVWVQSNAPGGCPVSSRLAKKDIAYLSNAELEALGREVKSTRLATYEYTDPARAGKRHLGFILEDNALPFAADAEHSQVDLYGYTSTLVAAVQLQQRQIDALEIEVKALRDEAARRGK